MVSLFARLAESMTARADATSAALAFTVVVGTESKGPTPDAVGVARSIVDWQAARTSENPAESDASSAKAMIGWRTDTSFPTR